MTGMQQGGILGVYKCVGVYIYLPVWSALVRETLLGPTKHSVIKASPLICKEQNKC